MDIVSRWLGGKKLRGRNMEERYRRRCFWEIEGREEVVLVVRKEIVVDG